MGSRACLNRTTGDEAFLAAVAELASTLTINEIEEFAGEMKALGEECGYVPLVSWGEKLAQSAGSFDMDAMTETLGGYGALIESIRRVGA